MTDPQVEALMLHTLAGHMRRCATIVTDREALQVFFMAAHKLDTRAEQLDRERRTEERQSAAPTGPPTGGLTHRGPRE